MQQLLDKTVGHSETSTYSKPQLKRFMSLGFEQEGSQAEVKIIESVLELGEKSVSVIMVSSMKLVLSLSLSFCFRFASSFFKKKKDDC